MLTQMLKCFMILGATLLVSTLGAQAKDDAPLDATTILKKAITAVGDQKLQEKLKYMNVKVKGYSNFDGQIRKVLAESHSEFPDKMLVRQKIKTEGRSHDLVVLILGEKMEARMNDANYEITTELKQALRQDVLMSHVTLLLPLLDDKVYTLKREEDDKVENEAAYVLSVNSTGLKDAGVVGLKLYFAKESGYLIKTSRRVPKQGEKSDLVEQEIFYSDFKKVDGLMLSMTSRTVTAGKEEETSSITEIKLSESAEPKTFELK